MRESAGMSLERAALESCRDGSAPATGVGSPLSTKAAPPCATVQECSLTPVLDLRRAFTRQTA
jgi:hypothetical protein